MKSVPTVTATVYCGLRRAYSDFARPAYTAKDAVRRYCDRVGLGVFFQEGKFLYKDGQEHGVSVGLIHYPRFPQDDPQAHVKKHAMAIARLLMRELEQERVSVVMADRTYMLERDTGDHLPPSS